MSINLGNLPSIGGEFISSTFNSTFNSTFKWGKKQIRTIIRFVTHPPELADPDAEDAKLSLLDQGFYYPKSSLAIGKVVPLILGRSKVNGLVFIYNPISEIETQYLVAWGWGSVQSITNTSINDSLVDDISEFQSEEQRNGGKTLVYPLSAITHYEPFERQDDIVCWNYTKDGDTFASSPGNPYGITNFTVWEDNAIIYIKFKALWSWSVSASKKIRINLYYRQANVGDSWTLSDTFDIKIGDDNSGEVSCYTTISGTDKIPTDTMRFDYIPAPTSADYDTLDCSVAGGYTETYSKNSKYFTAGKYDLKCEIDSLQKGSATDLDSGYLKISSIKVMEYGTSTQYFDSLAYTLFDQTTPAGIQPNSFSATIFGPNCKQWDAYTSSWVSDRVSNNPIWVAAFWATHWSNPNQLDDADIDWDFLKDEADYCDDIISTGFTTALAGSTDTVIYPASILSFDIGGYLIKDTVTGEIRTILENHYNDIHGAILVSPGFSNIMAGRAINIFSQRFTIDYAIKQQKHPLEWLAGILAYCHGTYWTTITGKLRMAVDRPVTSTTSITESDIIEGSMRVQYGDITKRPKATVVKHIWQSDNWKTNTEIYGDPDTKNIKEIRLPGCTRQYMALNHAEYYFRLAALDTIITFDSTLGLIELEPFDRLSIQYLPLGWGYGSISKKYVKILSIKDHRDKRTITCRPYDATIY